MPKRSIPPPEIITRSLGRAIAIVRVSRRLSQAELAKRVGISIAYMSRIESNDRTPADDVIRKIAREVKINVALIYHLAGDSDGMVRSSIRVLNEGLGAWLGCDDEKFQR